MRQVLGGKNKFDFVDGSIIIHTEFDHSFKAWNRCNMLIHSWIMNSLDESITQSIVTLKMLLMYEINFKNGILKVMIIFAFLNCNMRFFFA